MLYTQEAKFMKVKLYISATALFLSNYFAIAQTVSDANGNLNIIPAPSEIICSGGLVSIDGPINIIFDQELHFQAEIVSKFLGGIGVKVSSGSAQMLFISINNEYSEPESYEICIDKNSIKLLANSSAGISRAIATLKQLFLLNRSNSEIRLPKVYIFDKPKFIHRGLLLDCARHFFDKKTILQYIDLLAFYKLNTLHWHLTEDQAWRITIDKYPRLKSISSSRIEPNGDIYSGIYSKNDIREIVNYAEKRNITIIPEIELPGHSQAAIAAYPELSCTGEKVFVANDWGVFKEIYCAGNEEVFRFLKDVLSEVIDLFPSKYIHIGGDEVPKIRWENCQKCQKRIVDNNLDGERGLQSYFIKRIQNFLNANGREIIGWDEILEGGISSEAVIQSWRGVEYAIEALEAGNSVIMSPTSHAYLDYDLKAIDLKKIYLFDPIPKGINPKLHGQVIGGECNMWTEHVPDKKTLDSKVFPRLIGIAEALWSTGVKDYDHFNSRIESHYDILTNFNIQYGEESLPISYETFFLNDSLFLKLFSIDNENTEIYFKHVNTSSSANFLLYSLPILIDTNCAISARAFKSEKPYGEEIIIPLSQHKAINKEPKYTDNFSEFYDAGGKLGLVDGKLGTLDFRDGNWQGFWGKNIEIIIDLGKDLSQINEIISNFYQFSNSWIFLPRSIKIETSLDKKSWERDDFNVFYPLQNPRKREKEISQIKLIPNRKRKTRYIKIIIENFGKVPLWHEAAGSDSWIFIDEIQVH